jgi:hypothetical protein
LDGLRVEVQRVNRLDGRAVDLDRDSLEQEVPEDAAERGTKFSYDAGLWLALLAVLWVKSGIEERALMIRFPDYQAYKARTRKFLPGLLRPYSRSSSR